jgi:ribonucleoside-diphosphate reductase alpha chain
MVQLSDNALQIFKLLYSKENETIEDTFRRASKCVSKTEQEEELAYQLQIDNIIRFNTPLYFNSGGKFNLFSACWVVPLEDSMEGIYDIANVARKIFSYGSGIGIPIGNLREKDYPIYDGDSSLTPTGKSSGPIVFMKLYDAVAATTKSGGRARRAAILCTMPVWHPDILDFIHAKEIDGSLSNMNLSVTITDKFMQCLDDNIEFPLHTPYDGSFIKNEDPKIIWDNFCKQAHKTGDPGVIFIDTVNKFNPLVAEFLVETPNPCFTYNTSILTDKGHIAIGDIIKDGISHYKVISYDFDKRELEWDDIIWGDKTEDDANVIRIEFDDGSFLDTTPDQLIYTESGYIKAKDLCEESVVYAVAVN